jgi:hypothetical protein
MDCKITTGKCSSLLFTLLSVYNRDNCVANIAAYFFRTLRKWRRIFRVFNLCIFTHGIFQQVDLSFYCGLVIFTNIELGFKLLLFSILICVLKANLQLGLDCDVTKFPIQLFYNPWLQ